MASAAPTTSPPTTTSGIPKPHSDPFPTWASSDELASLAHHLNVEHATLCAVLERPAAYYHTERPRKKSGGRRRLTVPHEPLTTIQHQIAWRILHRAAPHPASHSCRGRSVLTNAEQHLGQRYVLTCDLENAFPSVRLRHITAALHRLGVPQPWVAPLLRLCTYEGCLPQGVATSSTLLELAMWSIDEALTTAGVRHGLRYTRYVDDICVSANSPLTYFLRTIRAELGRHGFRLSRQKTRSYVPGQLPTVTGLVLARRPSVAAHYRRAVHTLVARVVKGAIRLSEDEERSLVGRIAWITQHHPTEGLQLRRRLAERAPLRPTSS